jgi:integrase/recombinase XerC
MVNWAADSRVGLIKTGMCKYYKLPYTATPRQVLSLEEIGRILGKAELMHRVMFMCMSYAGLRVAEVCGLRWADVDLANSTIIVMGKGSKYRKVPLPKELTNTFWEWANKSLFPLGNAQYCFMSPLSLTGHVASLRLPLIQAAKAAGITKAVHPHMLRHSYATLLLSAGRDIRIIQELLGHASIMTTMLYTKVSPELKKKSIEGVFDGKRC